jgi:hypothetical protein
MKIEHRRQPGDTGSNARTYFSSAIESIANDKTSTTLHRHGGRVISINP